MAVFKHTLIFDGPGHGTSESLYYDLGPLSTVDTAFVALADVKNKRRGLLGREWEIKGERIEMVRNDTGDKVVRVGQVQRTEPPLIGVQAQPAAPVNVSLQVAFSNVAKSQTKRMFLAGCPKSLFPGGNTFDHSQPGLPGTWWSNFVAWRTLLQSLGAGWYTAPTTTTKKIVGYTFNPVNGQTSFNFDAAMPWPNTDKPVSVKVEFPLSKSPLDGTYLVIPTSSLSAYTAQPRPASPFTVGGTIRLTGSVLVTVKAASTGGTPGTIYAEVPMSRKRGRPLLVSRGRVQVRNRW